jgi:hypothetical protein
VRFEGTPRQGTLFMHRGHNLTLDAPLTFRPNPYRNMCAILLVLVAAEYSVVLLGACRAIGQRI